MRTLGPQAPHTVGDQRLLGFVFDVRREGTLHFGPLRSAHLAEQELWLVTKGTGTALKNLVWKGDRSNVQGVVGIVREQSTAVGRASTSSSSPGSRSRSRSSTCCRSCRSTAGTCCSR